MLLNTAQQCLSFIYAKRPLSRRAVCKNVPVIPYARREIWDTSIHPLALFDVIIYQMSNRISLIVSEGMQSKGDGSPHGLVAFQLESLFVVIIC